MESALHPRKIGIVNWIGVWTLLKREVLRFVKVSGQTLVAPAMTTLLYFIVFKFALGGRVDMAGGIPYLEFLAPGLVMMSMVQNAFANTSSSIMISKYDGTIVDLLMPPLSAAEIVFAKIMGGVARGLCVGVSTAFVIFFFVTPTLHSFAHLLFYAVMGSMMLSSFGLICSIISQRFDHIAAMTNFIVTPLTFLSGTFYSLDRLPENWQFLIHFNPFFYMIDGFRYGFIGYSDGTLHTGIWVLLLTNAVLWGVCQWMLQSGYKIKS